jgi:hypothetical protein
MLYRLTEETAIPRISNRIWGTLVRIMSDSNVIYMVYHFG